jgi:hypothetical protein
VAEQRFEVRYDRWCGWLIGLCGMGRRFSSVAVSDDAVRIVMGWAFRATIPRSSITAIRRSDGPVFGWGVHGWRGRWLVNGSSHGLVTISIDPPVASRVVGLPGRLRQVTVSLVDPDAFEAATAPVR